MPIYHTCISCNLINGRTRNDLIANIVEINVMWQNQQS
eukprot:CAMPEP_0194109390 /NCGR_PEP_ID=MMETSP0150-20130528/8894_1 /TAXON_ID=122233 /ORGANISM="Chaetoceros debilis, Strain MM31A-1" /LENGTH=37 /DNA_ID= /DNA_START= /DNA_END= /DNA_ORIENTATION=